MELSSQDQLRLNVLLAQNLQAVRIDESKMEVHALSDKGEAKVALNPNSKHERYLKSVRQLLSSHVLGSPGGYPVYLKRWTRMGQARDDSLAKLLLLGEPEAVVAVVHAPGLDDELARRAWWCEPSAENARQMLKKEAVSRGSMGRELAKFLLEFLPFEETTFAMMESVRLVLRDTLVDDKEKLELWKKGRRKNTYYVGFLRECPEALPLDCEDHPRLVEVRHFVERNSHKGQIAELLIKVLSAKGQAFVTIAIEVLKKPNDQDVVIELFVALQAYFRLNEFAMNNCREIADVENNVRRILGSENDSIKDILDTNASIDDLVEATLFMSMVSPSLLDPVFGLTDAIGSVMRKRIAHIVEPIQSKLAILSATK